MLEKQGLGWGVGGTSNQQVHWIASKTRTAATSTCSAISRLMGLRGLGFRALRLRTSKGNVLSGSTAACFGVRGHGVRIWLTDVTACRTWSDGQVGPDIPPKP